MALKTKYQYIEFQLRSDQPKKTSAWECYNRRTRYLLAEVKWYSAWRQYCFYPLPDTIFNDGCLRDVINFLGQLNYEKRKSAAIEKEKSKSTSK